MRCSTPSPRSCQRSSPVQEVALRGELELVDVGFAYPGAAGAVLSGISLAAHPGQTTAIIGSTGAGKTTLMSLIPRLVDATVGQRARRRHRRPRPRARGAVAPDRAGAAAALPVHRHGREQPAVRRPGRHRRAAVGGARDRPGPRLRRGDAAGAGDADRPGRHQRLRRPAPAAVHRPGARGQARDLPVRRLVLGARPRHRRPAAGGAAAAHPRRRPW